MQTINATGKLFDELNEELREASNELTINNCCGQRFIAAGFADKKIKINGTPGNALGAYLNGATINVYGNAQDAVGDTMNNGTIIVHGNLGDAAGYAMRGGKIYAAGNAGYRAGIHMKAYKEKLPLMVIGGKCGSFLGEYQAGGIIIALGLNCEGEEIVGEFPCTGMHGGKMYLRSRCEGVEFPSQVHTHLATDEDKREIKKHISEYCRIFKLKADEILESDFTVIEPDSKNPYKQMYVAN